MQKGLCTQCGQRLEWTEYENMPVVWLLIHDADEAGYWAAQYEVFAGTLFEIDYDEWRKSMVRAKYPLLLYFPFLYGRDYGKFMRLAAKDATIVKEFELI